MQEDNGRINYGVRLDNSQLQQDAERAKQTLSGIGTTAEKSGDQIDASIKKIGQAMAGVFAVSKLKDFATQVATVRGEFQQLEIAFQTMLGSKQQADNLMQQLIQTAVITPFNMDSIANSAKQLLAYGVEADKVNETLIRLGDIAAGLSIPINDLAYLYGTTMVQGRLYTQDLNQFLGRGIPLTEELAKQFGVTKSKVKDLVTEGKVGFPEVEKAIISLTSEGGKFGGLMEAQSKSITGQMANIEDAIEQMFNEIGKSSEGAISDVLSTVSSLIDHWREIGKVLLSVIAAYGTYKAAVLAVAAAHKIAAIWGEVQAFLSLAKGIKSAEEAMLLLNMATKANPLGLVLGVVASLVTYFGLLSDETNELTQMSNKYGESAAKEISRVNTLATTLNGLTEGTQTHKKILDELNGILEDYGLTQIKEGDNIDTVNQKREQAIELIKQEAIERQRANAMNAGEETYETALNNAQTALQNSLKNAMTGTDLGLFSWVSDNKELQQNADAISTIVSQIVTENISLVAGKTGDEWQKGVDQIYEKIRQRMIAIGIDEKTVSKEWLTDNLFNHTNIIQNYIDAIQEATEAHDNYTDKVNKSADAEQEAADKTMTFAERVAATQKSLQGASDDVHTLYKNIKNLMSKYNKNTIGFDIVFNAKVPAWMSKIPIKEVQRLASYFSSLGDTLAKQGKAGAMVNGKYMTTQQILQRGADYGQEAENRQNAAEEKQRQAEADKKEKDKEAKAAAQAAKRAQQEQQRLNDQIAERKKQIRQYYDSVAEAEKQAALDIEQQRLENMEDGYEKSRLTIDLHYQRLIAENERREREMLKALADNKVNEWLNANPKATKEQQEQYRNSLLDPKSKTRLTTADLTEGQQAQLRAYKEIADQIRQNELQSLWGNGQQAMDDYLKKYGTFQEQKYAIAAEYAARIKEVQQSSDTDEQKTWKIKALRQEQREQENTVEANAIMSRIDWYSVFGNVGGIMKDTLTPLLDDLKAFVKTDKFQSLGADQQQKIVEAMNNIREQVGSNADLGWQDLAHDLTAYQQALQEATQATQEYKLVQQAYAPLIADAQKKLQAAIQSGDTKAQQEAEDELNNLMAIVAQSGQVVTDANKKVKTSGQQLAQTTKGVMQPIDDIHNFLATTGLTQLQTVYDSVQQIIGGFDALKALKEAAKGVSDLGDGLEDASDDLEDVGDDVADSLSEGLSKAGIIGQIVAAILKILDVLKEGIGTLISSLIDSILGAIDGILKNILSGKFISQIVGSLVKGIGNILDTVIGAVGSVLSFGLLSSKGPSAWFTNSNAKEVAETTERLTTQNEALQHSIDKLKDSIDKNYGGKAISDYQEARKAQEARNKNLQEILSAQQGYHGAHHSNAYYWNISKEFTDQVNDLLGTALRGGDWSDWAKLTAEQMEKIRTYLPEVWTNMLAQGKYDKSEYFEQYADEAGKLEELTEQIRENLLNTSFEGLRDSFIDTLMDMSSSAEDFSDDFSEMMQRALLRAAISSKFDKQIQDWYTRITNDMMTEDGNYKELTETQIDSYKREWDSITNSMLAERDRIAQITGYTGDTDSEREASSKGIAQASQESIDELNGRATAIQGHTYNINENTKLLLQSTNLILRSVQNIDRNTESIPERLTAMEGEIKSVRATVNDIALKGIKIKS